MSTAYTQLDTVLIASLVTYATLASIACYIACKKLILRDFPGKRKINELQIEISDFSGMVADLTDRFNRFQKKEDMRSARRDKSEQASVLEQAREIVAGAAPEEPGNSKLDLYRRRGH